MRCMKARRIVAGEPRPQRCATAFGVILVSSSSLQAACRRADMTNSPGG